MTTIKMATIKDTLKRDFDLDPAQFSPEMRICLERLEKLEHETEELERQMRGQRHER